MKAEEIKEGDIVEIDYITDFSKEHRNEGKALVIWKGSNNQPLVRKLNTKATIWTCYEHIAKVIGHTDIEKYMDDALCIYANNNLSSGLEKTRKNSKKLEKDFGESDCISRADAIRVASGYCHPANVAREIAKLPSMGRYDPYTDKFIKE